MSIEDKLNELGQRLRDVEHNLTPDASLLLQASAHIANQERYIRRLKAQINDRYDRFLAAALQGLLGRATAATLMDGNDSLVKRARHIASLCVQAQPGEDS